MFCDRFSQFAKEFLYVALIPILFLCSIGFGQTSPVPSQGIPAPPETVPAGRQDAAALQQIQAYRQAVGADSWTGMQGQGEFTPNSPNSSGKPTAPQAATLWIRGDRKFRLDVQKPKGPSSLRMNGLSGGIQHEDGRTRPLDIGSTIVGLFAFPRLLKSGFPTTNITLIDQGAITVNGATLHRITMGIPWHVWQPANQQHPATTVVDLYFDPRSNLLVKSAALVNGSTSEPARYLRVIGYGDYRMTNGMNLPYLYSEQFSGQLLWTLQLDSIQFQAGMTDSDFRF